MNNTYRSWLQGQADTGDMNARQLLDFVGDDFGVNTNKVYDFANRYYANDNFGGLTEDQVVTQYANTINERNAQYSNQYKSGGGSVLGNNTGSYGTSGTTGYDPQAVALYDQGIAQANNQVGRLDVQQSNALGQLLSQYNQGQTGLNTQKARTTTDYETNKTQSTKDNMVANSNIDFQTGRQANALQRLLGSRGAGSSSAARVAAPYAAALQGTQQRGQVKDAFSQNMGALDTSFSRYNEDWKNSFDDLGRQYSDNQNQVKAGIAEKRMSLLDTLKTLTQQRQLAATGDMNASVAAAQPYLNQINQLGVEIDQLGTPRNIQVKNPTYAAPDLAKYDYDKASAPQLAGGSALQETISPYLSLLLKGKKNQPQF